MTIFFNPLSADQIKKISEGLEKKILDTETARVVFIGVSLQLLSLCLFLFSTASTGNETISGWDLVFKYRILSSQTFVSFHLLIISAVLLPIFTDRFRLATLLVLANIALFFIQYLVEAKQKISDYPETVNISIICFFLLMVCWILFGVESYKTEPRWVIFKWTSYLNSKVQYFYDQYGGLSFNKALKKFRKRHKAT